MASTRWQTQAAQPPYPGHQTKTKASPGSVTQKIRQTVMGRQVQHQPPIRGHPNSQQTGAQVEQHHEPNQLGQCRTEQNLAHMRDIYAYICLYMAKGPLLIHRSVPLPEWISLIATAAWIYGMSNTVHMHRT